MPSPLEDVGKGIASFRIQQNRQQKTLAYEAGVSLRTLQRLENGESVGLDAFVKVLQALGLKESLLNIVDLSPSPNTLKYHGNTERKRVRSPNPAASAPETSEWTWPEDQS